MNICMYIQFCMYMYVCDTCMCFCVVFICFLLKKHLSENFSVRYGINFKIKFLNCRKGKPIIRISEFIVISIKIIRVSWYIMSNNVRKTNHQS